MLPAKKSKIIKLVLKFPDPLDVFCPQSSDRHDLAQKDSGRLLKSTKDFSSILFVNDKNFLTSCVDKLEHNRLKVQRAVASII